MSQQEYQFTPAEHPLLPGGPYSPTHAPWRRAACAVLAVNVVVALLQLVFPTFAMASYRKVALNSFREVEDALAAVQRTSEQELVLRQQRDALARALVQATSGYRAGYSSYLEQLDAQRGLLSADLSLVQANSDRLSAAVSLFQAVGGGWTEGAR